MTRYTIAVDQSDAARAALQWIDEVVDEHSDSVRLVTVFELFGELSDEAEIRLLEEGAVLRERHAGLRVATEIVGGWTVHSLVEEGERGDVLVVGGQQRHRLVASLRGRVAERTVASATVPVVVVPEIRTPHAGGPLLVGVDSRTADTALVFAADTAARRGIGLVLVRAWQPPSVRTPYGIAYDESDLPTWRGKAELELAAALRAVDAARPGLGVAGRVRRGSAAGVLLRESTSASLIVIGRRHHTAVGGLLVGSIGETLMHRAHVPVAVVGPCAALPSGGHGSKPSASEAR